MKLKTHITLAQLYVPQKRQVHTELSFLKEEISRAAQLGIKNVVLHPGASVSYDRKESIQSISPNYLAPLLLEKAKLPQTAYYKYLNDLREEIPSITTMAYQDKSGKLFDANEPKGSEAELIQQYDILQYNNVFDKDHLVTEKFAFTE